jgi:hypothetical protein
LDGCRGEEPVVRLAGVQNECLHHQIGPPGILKLPAAEPPALGVRSCGIHGMMIPPDRTARGLRLSGKEG